LFSWTEVILISAKYEAGDNAVISSGLMDHV